MAEHWYIKAKEQFRTETGEKFVLVTDSACHLWMRWTLISPKIHNITRLRRGLAAMDDWYYCFDVYEDNEQEEPGDTIIHTFIKEPWPYCEERWFYYHGTYREIPSPSTSPIFYKHPIAPPLPDYIPACYQLDYLDSRWAYFHQYRERAFPFKPCRTYNADTLIVYLNRAIGDLPLQEARFALYNANDFGKPIGDPITSIVIPINPPIEPAYEKCTAAISLTNLILDQTYAIGLRGEPTGEPSPRPVAYTAKAEGNTCIAPARYHYRIWDPDTGWGDWTDVSGTTYDMYEVPERL